MDNETTNIGDPLKNYYILYSVPALLNHKEREFGTVIVEAKNKLIIVDDEIIREHVYLIPRQKWIIMVISKCILISRKFL